MKVALALAVALFSACSFADSYYSAVTAERSLVESVATKSGQAFLWPSDDRLSEPIAAYESLRRVALANHVNVIRTTVGYGNGGEPQVAHYLFSTGPTHITRGLRLSSGRWMTIPETQTTGAVVSTSSLHHAKQVGRLTTLGEETSVSVMPLRDAFDTLPVAGQYIVEVGDVSTQHKFFEALAQEAQHRFGVPVSPDRFQVLGNSGGAANDDGPALVLHATGVGLLIVVLLLSVYHVLLESKHIAVLRLHGISGRRTWYLVVGRSLIVSEAFAFAGCLGLALCLPGSHTGFMSAVSGTLLLTYTFLAAASFLLTLGALRVPLAHGLQSRRNGRSLFFTNCFFKGALAAIALAILVPLWQAHSQIANQRAMLAGWASSHDYGIFYPTFVGNDQAEMAAGAPGPTDAEVNRLYPILNQRGALYVDASSYEPEAVASSDAQTIRSVRVNTNYLGRYPIKGVDGRPVSIYESTSDWIVLVPTQYHAEKLRIEDYFQSLRTGGANIEGAVEAEMHMFHAVPPAVRQQRVRIVWIADGQQLFSFNPHVFPADGNMVTGPIVEVMTAANSLGVDRLNAVTGGGHDALKVPILGSNFGQTLASIAPVLKQFKLDDNLRSIVGIDEYMQRQIVDLQESMKDMKLAALSLMVALLGIEAQAVAVFWHGLARRLTIRRLLGWGYWRTYRLLAGVLLVAWVIEVGAAAFLSREGLPFGGSSGGGGGAAASVRPEALGVGAVSLGVIEMILAMAGVLFVERRNVGELLKGGL